MPSFNIVKKSNPEETFRVSSVLNAFDLNKEKVKEHFKGSIDIEGKNWNIGLIVGGSGTGKSTIANDAFGDFFINYEYSKKSVIDDMPKNCSVKEITKAFTSVGFASPPSWLKPYDVLSNGEKMRVDLAYSILKKQDLIIFDEFTSVVNREVAKTGSYAISKAIRRLNKKFIAVACHSDIIDWLEPDWIYNTDEQRFFFCPDQYKRPEIKLNIYRTNKTDKKQIWNAFKKYHYLNESLHTASEQWIGVVNNQIICHTGVIQFPLRKGWKRIHRLVVLPDYQGIGIGIKFINEVSRFYKDIGWNINLTTTTPSLVYGLGRNNNWALVRKGRVKNTLAKNMVKYYKDHNRIKDKELGSSEKRITYSFVFKK